MRKHIFIFMLFISIAYISRSNNESSIESFDPSAYTIAISPNASYVSLCNTYKFTLNGPALPTNAYIRWTVSEQLKIRGNPYSETLSAKAVQPGNAIITAYITYYGIEYQVSQRTFSVLPYFLVDTYYSDYSTTRSETIEGMILGGTITINSGHTFTIKGTLKCTPKAKIIVKPGGKLVIDGGKLTTYCSDEVWQGIIVRGTRSNTNQSETIHGVVELKNNAIIENALVAIKAGDSYSYGGGIIKAEDAIFRNNLCAVEFSSYKRMSGSDELNNLSYFTRCNFIINDMNNLDNNGYIFDNGMVKLESVKGIKFNGCIFRNDMAATRFPPKRGMGIHSINAGFLVNYNCKLEWSSSDGCRGCSGGLIKSQFIGFEYGIYATGSPQTFKVENSLFSNNYYSIYAGSIHNFNIFTSTFNLHEPAYVSIPDAYAIKIESCRDFKLEANSITDSSGEYTGRYIGMHIKNCGLYDSKIYRNTFTGLKYGIYIEGNNGGYLNGTAKGLRIECNKFKNGRRSIGRSVYIPSTATVSPIQGSLSKGANNEFIDIPFTNSNPNNRITYYYCNSNECYGSSYLTCIQGGTNPCKQTICGWEEHRDSSIVVGHIYPILPVSFGNDNDDLSVYNKMNEVYTSYVEEFNLSDYASILKESKKEEINESIRIAYNDALVLQNEMEILSSKMGELSQKNISNLLDNEKTNKDKLQNWYKAANGLSEKYSLVESYREHGDFVNASSLFAEIPYMFELDESEYQNYLNYADLNNFRDNIINSGRYFNELTEVEISELQDIANNVDGNASILANGILCYFYNLCPERGEIEEPFEEFIEERAISVEKGNISLFPNPASDEISIKAEELISNITIIDYLGKKILELNKINNYNASVNIKEIPAGIYFVKVDTEKESTYIKFVKE